MRYLSLQHRWWLKKFPLWMCLKMSQFPQYYYTPDICYYHTYKSLFSVLKGRVWRLVNSYLNHWKRSKDSVNSFILIQNVLILAISLSFGWYVIINGTPVTDLGSRLFFYPNFTVVICESIIFLEYSLSKNHDFISSACLWKSLS